MQISNFTLEIDTKMRFFVHCHFYHLLSHACWTEEPPSEGKRLRAKPKNNETGKKLAFLFFLQTLVC